MAILGVGIDLVDVERMRMILNKNNLGDRFIKKIGTLTEQSLAPLPLGSGASAQYWATRFAAREAFGKALGIGIFSGFSLHEVEVRRVVAKGESSGIPELFASGRALELLKSRGVKKTHLSLSHTETSAIAVVVLES